MNLTQLIQQTGRQQRAGKPPSERLSNAQIRQVLETALTIMTQALEEEGRFEAQGFLVIERRETPARPGGTLKPQGQPPTQRQATTRVRWRVRLRKSVVGW